MSNTELWDSVEKTDPKHVKAITGKSYQGSSPKPHYLVRKATETFGPCGIGWGFNIVSERIEEGAGGEKMHIAHVRLWYKWRGETGSVEHVGGTQFSGTRSSGKPFTDEDAPKKSITDALVKALSMVGFAGDIFMGRYDDSKYVNEVKAEFSEEKQEPYPPKPKQKTVAERKAIWAQLMDDLKAEAPNGWRKMVAYMENADTKTAIEELGDYKKQFLDEARELTKLAKAGEEASGEPVAKAMARIMPDFSTLDTSPTPDAIEELLERQGDSHER